MGDARVLIALDLLAQPVRTTDQTDLCRGTVCRGAPGVPLQAGSEVALGEFDDAFTASVESDADALAAGVREAAMTATTRDPRTVLDNVYAEPHSGIDEQREWFSAYLDGFAAEEAGR